MERTYQAIKENQSRVIQRNIRGKNLLNFIDNREYVDIQKKRIENIHVGQTAIQAKLPSGVTYKEQSAKVWLGTIKGPKEKTDGILCNKKQIVGEASNKSLALASIASEAAAIGENCGNIWLKDDNNYNKIDIEDGTNPFRLPICAKYRTTKGHLVMVTMDYHFGPFNNGYIVSVEKINEKDSIFYPVITEGYMVMNSDNSSNKVDAAPAGDKSPSYRYSNKHDADDTNSILDTTKELGKTDKKKEREKKFDAYTKLAGEGARFQCVRNNISIIKNNTIFWTEGKGSNGIVNPGITFNNLWLSWGSVFGQKFNVNNEDLKGKLKDHAKWGGKIISLDTTGENIKL